MSTACSALCAISVPPRLHFEESMISASGSYRIHPRPCSTLSLLPLPGPTLADRRSASALRYHSVRQTRKLESNTTSTARLSPCLDETSLDRRETLRIRFQRRRVHTQLSCHLSHPWLDARTSSTSSQILVRLFRERLVQRKLDSGLIRDVRRMVRRSNSSIPRPTAGWPDPTHSESETRRRELQIPRSESIFAQSSRFATVIRKYSHPKRLGRTLHRLRENRWRVISTPIKRVKLFLSKYPLEFLIQKDDPRLDATASCAPNPCKVSDGEFSFSFVFYDRMRSQFYIRHPPSGVFSSEISQERIRLFQRAARVRSSRSRRCRVDWRFFVRELRASSWQGNQAPDARLSPEDSPGRPLLFRLRSGSGDECRRASPRLCSGRGAQRSKSSTRARSLGMREFGHPRPIDLRHRMISYGRASGS